MPGGAVSGRILDEHGIGVADCRVTLGSIDQTFPELEAARLSPVRERIPSCTSDAQGRFRLLGVAQGMTRLWAHAAGRKAGYTPPFEVRAGQESTGVELVLEPLAFENLLRGIVVDPAGNAVPYARIEYRHSFDGGNSVRSGESTADGNGRFEFTLREDARSDADTPLEAMVRGLFSDSARVRLRPSFFPYTEPSAEVDISCQGCGGSGCPICKHTGWLEILGSGMVHPAVLEAVGYDPDKVSGFAFGTGIERIAMLKYRIGDIRMFYENDLRFLEQFPI